MMEKERTDDGHRSRFLLWGLCSIIILAVIYFFSYVPVIWGFQKFTGDVPRSVSIFYKPLDAFYMNSEISSDIMNAQGDMLGDPMEGKRKTLIINKTPNKKNSQDSLQ